MGGKRSNSFSNNVSIQLETYVYRLRIAQALLEEHNRTVLQSQATLYVATLVEDLLGAAEDASSTLAEFLKGARDAPEADLGQEQL